MRVKTGDRPKRYTLLHDGEVVTSDTLDAGDYLVTPLDVVAAEDEGQYLGALAPHADAFPPLPETGWLEAGALYRHGASVVIVRQSHERTLHAPEDTLALFMVYREEGGALEWVAGEPVQVGVQRTYGGATYRCLQAHVTQQDWLPPATPALWGVVVESPTTREWRAGAAYAVGDEVTYAGVTYRCLQAHTSIVTWEPPRVAALWRHHG